MPKNSGIIFTNRYYLYLFAYCTIFFKILTSVFVTPCFNSDFKKVDQDFTFDGMYFLVEFKSTFN